MVKFDKTLSRAADVLVELRAAESQRKLTPKAFKKEARKLAGCTASRLDHIEILLGESRASDAALAFIRKVTKEFCETTYVRPFSNAGKAMRIFGALSN